MLSEGNPVWKFVVVASLVLLCAAVTEAGEADSSREISNISVMGVEAMERPTHGESFEMLQYTPDPIEGFNRGSLRYVTKPFMDWVMRPLAIGWRSVFPNPVRESLDNVQYNLTYPSRLVSLLFQAEGRKSLEETEHFLINSTVGVLGLFDPASGWEIPTHRQDMGLTFARWGSGPGFYLMIPLLGPSSGRDGLGRIFDTALNPATYLFGASLLFNVNAFSSRIDGYDALMATNPDVYPTVRALWAMQREIEVQRYRVPESAYATADPEPSLGILRLKLYDPEFPRDGRESSIRLPKRENKLSYSYWLQPKPAPLIVIIPGIGSHRASRNPVALAEVAYDSNYSVVTVTSPFHPEFILSALSEPYPGYTPGDSEDLYEAISAIRGQLERRHPGAFTSTSLAGYSLGGLETLFIAAAQDKRPPDALRFDRFVALNPPVNLRYAADQFDAYFDAPLRWPARERDERVKQLAMKAFLVLRDGIDKDETLPFDRTESEFLIGLQGRTTLINTLDAIRDRGEEGLRLERDADPERGPLLSAVNQSSLGNYGDQLAVPHYLKKGDGLSRDELLAATSLPAIENALRTDERIRVLTTADDFIVSDEQRTWLREVMGERLTIFPTGGHLGNLYLPEVQRAVYDALQGRTPTQLTPSFKR